MAEQVSTGGLMQFHYGKHTKAALDATKKREIKEAYGRYYARVRDERRNRVLIWLAVIVLVLLGISLYTMFN